MRNIRRTGWPAAVVAAAAIMTAAAALAGCGTASIRAGASGPGRAALAQTPGSEPPHGSRAQALVLARRLLSRLVLPAGAQPAHVSPLPPELQGPANLIIGSADVHRLFALRQPMPAVHDFLLAHVPAGMRRDSTGQGRGQTGVTMQSISYAPLSLPSGITREELAATVIPGSDGSSLVRADAQVSWLRPRTAAEHLSPAALQSVTISATLSTFQNRRPHPVSRVSTSSAVLAQFARLLNGLPAAAQPSVMNCPASAATYRLQFARKGGNAPSVVATTHSCAIDTITVNGKAQPALWDPENKLAAAAGRFLH